MTKLSLTFPTSRQTRLASALAAAAVALMACEARAGSVIAETEEQEYPLSQNATVTIRNTDGRIHVFGSDKDELKIVAVKRAFTQERLDGIRINAVVNADSAVIDTIYPPPPQGRLEDRSGTVDYMIFVPQASTLAKAELAKGEVLLQDLRGASATATVSNGRMVVRDCFTKVSATVGNGGMDLFYMWWEEGQFSLSAEVENANVRLALPPNAAARLDVASTHGSVRNNLPKAEKQQGHIRSIVTTVGDESDVELKIRATRGNIRVEKSY
jgi:hypothetical protein